MSDTTVEYQAGGFLGSMIGLLGFIFFLLTIAITVWVIRVVWKGGDKKDD